MTDIDKLKSRGAAETGRCADSAELHEASLPAIQPDIGKIAASLEPVAQLTEASGFTRGGVNESLVIGELGSLSGTDFDSLEASLIANDLLESHLSLKDLLIEDNDTVLEYGYNHGEMAWALKLAAAICEAGGDRMTLGGHEYSIQKSDEGAASRACVLTGETSSTYYTLTSEFDTLEIWSGLIMAIEQFGFYGGGGKAFRVSPELLLDFFEMEKDGFFSPR